MDNKTYLSAAERTEKKLEHGLIISGKTYHEIGEAFKDLIEAAQRIDSLKKLVIYKGDSIEGVPTVTLNQGKAELLHALMGMAGEVGEIAAAVGSDLTIHDTLRLLEEMGDYRWYEAAIYRQTGTTQEVVQAMNIRKLAARYPEKYTDVEALERNYAAELEAMAGEGPDLLGR